MTRVLTLLGCLLLAACSDPRADADGLARAAGFRTQEIATNPFRLRAYLRPGNGARVLRVYIEGDGHAWMTRDTPSDDPTPWSPVMLRLAAADRSAAVAYLGRPCQYVVADPACGVRFWTGARYAEPVIGSTSQALDALLAMTGARRLELVGFSGGGAVAALVAARRGDVDNLRTVAANLDTVTWTRTVGVSPLSGSLNPADAAPRLVRLPQVHFVGGDDTVVSREVVSAFIRRMADDRCASLLEVPGVSHDGAWAERWPSLLAEVPTCRDAR